MKKIVFREERLEAIYKMAKRDEKVFVPELAKHFDVSPSSIRLDLAELEERGLIQRTYGGAIIRQEDDGIVEDWPVLSQRSKSNQAEKEAIGKLAASLIDDNDNIIIDGGSTTECVANNLDSKRNLIIITNSVSFLPKLMSIKDSVVYIAGGLIYKNNGVVVGDIANEIVDYFNPRKAIVGMDGVSVRHGFTVANPDVPAVASIKRKMIESADELIVVCDHTKFERVCLMPVAPLSKAKYIVTDDRVDPELVAAIEEQGPIVLKAKVEV